MVTPLQLFLKHYIKINMIKFGLRKWGPSDGPYFFTIYGTILIFFFIMSVKNIVASQDYCVFGENGCDIEINK